MVKDDPNYIPLKDFVTYALNEREAKYNQRLQNIDKEFNNARLAVKDAFNTANLLINKSESTTDKRFESIKNEMGIRFEALEKKLDTAITQLETNKGRDSGIAISWGIFAVVLTIIIAMAGVIVAVWVR